MPVQTRECIILDIFPVSDVASIEFKEARRIWRQERKSRRLRENALLAGHPHPIPPPSPVSQSTPEPSDPAPSVPLPLPLPPATPVYALSKKQLLRPSQSPLWSATAGPSRGPLKSRIDDRHHPYIVPLSKDA